MEVWKWRSQNGGLKMEVSERRYGNGGIRMVVSGVAADKYK